MGGKEAEARKHNRADAAEVTALHPMELLGTPKHAPENHPPEE
jgi:hypothetical protein